MASDCAGPDAHVVLRHGPLELRLLPERAVWWPDRKTLFVADVHLGKAAAYRRLGQPVPEGPTAGSLARLTALVGQYHPSRLIVLGDFIHDAHVFDSPMARELQQWRDRHRDLRLTVIRGNHDASLAQWPADLRIEDVGEPFAIDDDRQCIGWHVPPAMAADAASCDLAGHWHPAVVLRDGRHDRMRLPCFVLHGRSLVLPAFGDFTGGDTRIVPATAQCFAVGGGRVWPIPSRAPPRGPGRQASISSPNGPDSVADRRRR